MFKLSQELPSDFNQVEVLYDLSFAPGRKMLSSYRLREGVCPITQLCFVLRDEYGNLCGAIRYWPVQVGGVMPPVLLLGPIAVHPTRQGEGLGAWLMRHSLQQARSLQWQGVILIGDASYYNRFGFRRSRQLDFPPPTDRNRILYLNLQGDSKDQPCGVVEVFSAKNSDDYSIFK